MSVSIPVNEYKRYVVDECNSSFTDEYVSQMIIDSWQVMKSEIIINLSKVDASLIQWMMKKVIFCGIQEKK